MHCALEWTGFNVEESFHHISFDKAMSDAESDEWLEDMEDKVKSMQDSLSLDLEDLPKGFKLIRWKWICKTKKSPKEILSFIR